MDWDDPEGPDQDSELDEQQGLSMMAEALAQAQGLGMAAPRLVREQPQRRQPSPRQQPDQEPQEVVEVQQYDPPVDEVDEVQQRLDVAACYRAVLQRGVFNDGTQASSVVEAEIQDFVKGRLAVLIGLQPERAPALSFDDDEVRILKVLASAARKGSIGRKAGPPVVRQAAPPAQPSLRAPEPPRALPPVAQVPQQAPPAASRPQAARRPPAQPRRRVSKADQVPDEVVFDEGGKKYMWRTNELGTRYRVDVTPQAGAGSQAANPHHKPLPLDPSQMEMLSAAQAATQVRQATAGSQLFHTIMKARSRADSLK